MAAARQRRLRRLAPPPIRARALRSNPTLRNPGGSGEDRSGRGRLQGELSAILGLASLEVKRGDATQVPARLEERICSVLAIRDLCRRESGIIGLPFDALCRGLVTRSTRLNAAHRSGTSFHVAGGGRLLDPEASFKLALLLEELAAARIRRFPRPPPSVSLELSDFVDGAILLRVESEGSGRVFSRRAAAGRATLLKSFLLRELRGYLFLEDPESDQDLVVFPKKHVQSQLSFFPL